MNRGKVRVLSAKRPVPKLVVGQEYDVVIHQGKESIMDGYGRWVPLAQIEERGVTLEGV